MDANEARLRDMAQRIKNIQDIFPQAEPQRQEEFAAPALPLLDELERFSQRLSASSNRIHASKPC